MAAMLLFSSLGFVACNKESDDQKAGDDDSQSALVCVEQIIDGCMDIANEVGNAKIGDPYDLYRSGQTEKTGRRSGSGLHPHNCMGQTG